MWQSLHYIIHSTVNLLSVVLLFIVAKVTATKLKKANQRQSTDRDVGAMIFNSRGQGGEF